MSGIFQLGADEGAPQFRAFAMRVREILRGESCSVFLVRQSASAPQLELVALDSESGYDPPPLILPIRSKRRGGLTSHLAQVGKIARLSGNALKNHPYSARTPDCHLKAGSDYSLLSFPLHNRKGQLLGLVQVQNKRGDRGRAAKENHFDELDATLAAFLSYRLAVAIEGHRTIAFLKALVSERGKASGVLSFENTALMNALSLVGANSGSLALWDTRKQRLTITAHVGEGSRQNGDVVPKRGVMSTVWTTEESMIIPDVRKHPDPYFENNPHTRSELAVLVTHLDYSGRSRSFGVLNVESFSRDGFDAQDQIVLEGVAHTIGAAIAATSADLSLREALANLSAPARVFSSPTRLFSSILERVRETYGFDRGIIYTAEEISGVLRLSAQMGCDHLHHLVGTYVHPLDHRSLAAHVWRKKEAAYSSNPRRDRRVSRQGLDQWSISGPLMALPLIHSGKALGVLVCWSEDGPVPLKLHVHQLAPFAQVVAAEIAIVHAYDLLDEWIHTISQPSQTIGNLTHKILDDVGTERGEEIITLLQGQTNLLVNVVQRSRRVRYHQRVLPAFTDVDLLGLVVSVGQSYTGVAASAGLDLKLDVPTAKCVVRGDASRLAIAMEELLDNAVKYSVPAGGEIGLSLVKVRGGFKVEVSDQGSGVRPGQSRTIYRPYVSVSPEGRPRGVGLGLTIAYGVVSQHQGTLNHRPNPDGRGTIFSIFIPMDGANK